MKQVLFVDTTTPRPYSHTTLETEAMGGTEASVVRIAEALGQQYNVTVMQTPRTKSEASKHVTYSPLKNWALYSKDHAVIVMRDAEIAIGLKKHKPDTQVFLWCQDWLQPSFTEHAPELKKLGVRMICVSTTHKNQAMSLMRDFDGPIIHTIYNPLDESLDKDATPVDKNKLVFFSSPHKGLAETVVAFRKLREINPEFHLHIANPGYYDNPYANEPGLTIVGKLPHKEVIKHVRESLCVFYPNPVFSETFGCVFAEANAVGTPVLAHGFGAAHEIMTDWSQIVDGHDLKDVVETTMKWYAGERPKVSADPRFRLNNVIKVWRTVLG